jgi:pyridoxamine 5'-phosphate oxidase
MIKFINSSIETPYLKLKEKYDDAINANQKNIEAVSISSYSKQLNEVTSRFVNLKYVNNKDFIFFSNYNSPKGKDFINHDQIAVLIYWNSINVQVRLKAKISKTPKEFNQTYFRNRSEDKNALAISSNQSKPIDSYNQVRNNYNRSLKNDDLKKCPEFWGGYSFTPYYFEFWKGHESRLNKREVYEKSDNIWEHLILQP